MRTALIFAAVTAAAAGSTSAAARAPAYSASIVRTALGIPHITASDWRGIGYGVAYAYAQDNLCLLAEEFATVAGERSRHFGAGGKATLGFEPVDNLTSDLFFRSAINLAALRRGARAMAPEQVQLSAGYVAGYNRLLRDLGPAGVPAACQGKAWVRAITGDDMLRLTEKQMLLASSLNFAGALVAAQPPGTAAVAANGSLPEAHPTGIGSNGWAFGSDVTEDGRGLLVGNPHFPWAGPSRFWQMHVTIPGKLDAMGAGIAGSPIPTIGFNKDVAWTHTVTAAQHFTLYQLKLDPADPTRYLVDGKSVKMTAQTVILPAAGPATAVTRTFYSTQFGRVIAMPAIGAAWSKTTAFTLRDANQGNQRGIGTWIAYDTARNVGEIRAAAERSLGIPWVNTIAADRFGNVLHADVTAVPNVSAAMARDCATPLSRVIAGRAVLLDGSRAACMWQTAPGTPAPGLMPASDQAVYARRDYVANSNDNYWLSNAGAPYRQLSPILGSWGTQRSLRTRSGLTEITRALAQGKLTRARVQDMVFANHSLAAELALAPVLALCRGGAEPSASVAAACAALAQWDGKFDVTSRGAYLFQTFWLKARSTPGLWTTAFDAADPVNTPRGLVTSGAPGAALIAALKAAANQLAAQHIALDAPWGEVQFALNGADHIPVHGADGALGVLNVQMSEPVAGGIVPRHGSSYVQIVGFDATGPVADAVLSYSQSSDPASPHFADQTRLYSAKQWHRLPFTPAQIAADNPGEVLRISE